MKKLIISMLLAMVVSFTMTGCDTSSTVSEDEYEDVLDEMEKLEEEIEDLEDALMVEQETVESLNNEEEKNREEITYLFDTIMTLEDEIDNLKVESQDMATSDIPEGFVNYGGHYHGIEFHGETMYCIYENADMTIRLLLALNPYEPAKVLMEGPFIGFRGSQDGELVAAENGELLTIMTSDGEMIDTYSYQDLLGDYPYAYIEMEGWSSNSDFVWASIKETYEVLAYLKIDIANGSVTTYYNEKDLWYFDELALDYDSGLLAYSDYPFMFDVDSQHIFNESKQMVNLYVYNLGTMEETLIASGETNKFVPMWSTYQDKTITYVNNGEYVEYTIE